MPSVRSQSRTPPPRTLLTVQATLAFVIVFLKPSGIIRPAALLVGGPTPARRSSLSQTRVSQSAFVQNHGLSEPRPCLVPRTFLLRTNVPLLLGEVCCLLSCANAVSAEEVGQEVGRISCAQQAVSIGAYKDKLQKLRTVVSNSAALIGFMGAIQVRGGGLQGGSVDALRERVERGKEEVLIPFLQELFAATPQLSGALVGDENKRAEDLPVLLKGIISDLDDSLRKGLFGEFTETKTGKVYTGGQVERKIEEAEEVADTYLKLVERCPKSAV
eukprot:TRINITY_DN46901_c0_g1_i1.p1 TRINITY_DN46901_c0_g1~~TRINITY_DN46901_c0_g1_i1.p1  ORF type:complete len:296 (+),score=37.43 TRINITY_DN46901_c0_g1_i1:71-889(+)